MLESGEICVLYFTIHNIRIFAQIPSDSAYLLTFQRMQTAFKFVCFLDTFGYLK